MRIKNESELLKPEVRAQIIQEIKASENQQRKHKAYKRYQCYKDNTKRYVVENMLQQLDLQTVIEMKYSISNISIVKKVIDKLARVYSNGVVRELINDEVGTENLKKIEKYLELNSAMKSQNRYLKLQKNLPLYVKPCPVYEGENLKWTVKLQPLNPYLYDAVEDYYDRTKPLAFILSNYKPLNNVLTQIESNGSSVATRQVTNGNGIDEKIADKSIDQGAGEPELYVFWSKNYHFTTTESGEIIQDDFNKESKNPFGEIPIVNFSLDQDGSFFADGGDDIIDGAILLNSMVTHTNHVAVSQGYGQAFMTGENLPRQIKVGPTKIILGEYKKDEQPQPTFDFKSANPQIDSMRGLVEAYLALLLTTNNLSTSGISAQLNGQNSAASGIALILDKAESLEDAQDQRQIFLDKEPKIWAIIQKIMTVYQSSLTSELASLGLPDDIEEKIKIKFHDPEPIMTEKEKLETMKLREELGLESMIGMLMKDDASLSEKDAEEKLKKIFEQRLRSKLNEDALKTQLGVESVEVEGGDEDGKEDSKKDDKENNEENEVNNESQ